MHSNLFPNPGGVFYGENGYLDLLRFVLKNGEKRPDRTGTGVVSYFSPPNIEFDLSDGFPLITTKKVFFRGVIEELLFFLRGDTNTKKLEEAGVNIWKGNTSREFLDSQGLSRLPEGSFGEGYGWQWRKFGKKYLDEDCCCPTTTSVVISGITTYTGYNTITSDVENMYYGSDSYADQISILIDELKNNKFSRRHVVSAWNPNRLHMMALPPCHMMFQMYVTQTNTLHCKMYMRSVDLGCGLPFNIASYAALTHILSDCCGYTPGRLIIDMGDAHIYNNHVEGLTEQISRTPYKLPSLTINTEINSVEDIEKLKFENFVLIGYNSHPSIPLKMSV